MRFSEFNITTEDTQGGIFQLPPQLSTSTDILNLQKILSAFNYNIDINNLNGTIDDLTKQAIQSAQRDLGLQATGLPDSEFISRLNTSLTAVPEINNIMASLREPKTIGLDTQIPANQPIAGKIDPNNLSDLKVPHYKSKLNKIHSSSPLAHDPKFLAKVDEVASALGVESSVLMRIMKHESQLNPKAKSPNGRAVGLIQFMEPAAESLGTTVREIYNMDAIEQMDLVLRYYKMVGVKPGMNVGDVYMLTFLPKYKNSPDNTILGRKNDPTVIQRKPYITKHNVWDENPAFSHNKTKDYFTKADVIDRINNTYA